LKNINAFKLKLANNENVGISTGVKR